MILCGIENKKKHAILRKRMGNGKRKIIVIILIYWRDLH